MNNSRNSTRRGKRKADFALRVRIALLNEGMSLAELASDLGVHRNSIYLATRTDLCRPLRTRIANHLGISA